MTTEAIKKKILPILKRQGVIRAAVFGSFARGEETKNSDIDILVKMAKNKSLLDLVGLKIELEDKLGRDVDVISYGGIHPLLKNIILKEQQIIYESKKRS
jgi:predicted nucleotidyltransferase